MASNPLSLCSIRTQEVNKDLAGNHVIFSYYLERLKPLEGEKSL
jgi:hypothetical protein